MEDEEDTPTSTFASTLLIDFEHLQAYHTDLADAVQQDFSRFDPFLCKATSSFLRNTVPV